MAAIPEALADCGFDAFQIPDPFFKFVFVRRYGHTSCQCNFKPLFHRSVTEGHTESDRDLGRSLSAVAAFTCSHLASSHPA
jgi:hypothetical protein